MTAGLANHLWQSTLFVAIAGLLVLALRNNRASVRYWIWFSASVKFLLPFSLLIALGSHTAWAPAARNIAPQPLSITVIELAQPVPDIAPVIAQRRVNTDWLPLLLAGIWAAGFLGIASIRLRDWILVARALRSGRTVEFAGLKACCFPGLLEPGVVGILQQTLLFPEGMVNRLTPSELEAVLAHELCHVRRHDNLLAAIHMLVEMLFWFHPMVVDRSPSGSRTRACLR